MKKSKRFDSEKSNGLLPPIFKQLVKAYGESAFDHTFHSKIRAEERGIDEETISTILYYGTDFYLQGYIFYTLLAKDLPRSIAEKIRKKTRNIIVMTAESGRLVITCYKNKNPIKYLKNKTKRLRR